MVLIGVWNLWVQCRVHTLSLLSAWGEAREDVIGLSSGGPQQSVLLYTGILSTHLKFRTHKCNLCEEMKPSARFCNSCYQQLLAFNESMSEETKSRARP